jgi:hypothetical protein
MTLHGDHIRCVGGECHAHVFENPRTGLARNLFWDFVLECAPLMWEGDEAQVSVLCDWVTLPTRRWTEVSVSLRDIPSPELLESSFYLSAHHDVRLEALEIAHAGQDLFRVRIAGRFDLEGYGDLDGKNIAIDLEARVRFRGLIVMPENLFPKPASAADAIAVAGEFLELDELAAPQWDGDRYWFEPRMLAHKLDP